MNDIVRASEALDAPLAKLYRIGGYELALIFAGALLLLSGRYYELPPEFSLVSAIVPIAGAICLLGAVAMIFFTKIRGVAEIRRELNEKAEFIDNMQLATLELTTGARILHEEVFKHSDKVAAVVREMKNEVKIIPVVGNKLADAIGAADKRLESHVVYYSGQIKEIAQEIDSSVRNVDPKALSGYVERLRQLHAKLRTNDKKQASQIT